MSDVIPTWRFLQMSRRQLALRLLFMTVSMFVMIGGLLFGSAGSLHYWEAWVYCGVLCLPAIVSGIYFLLRDPEFLERRMKTHEKEAEQRFVQFSSGFLFFVGFLIAGLDHRFGWSDVSVTVVIVSDFFVLLGYLLIFRVFQVNRYAARTVEVEAGQQVISTGPYAIVRHPMYLGVVLMYMFTPFALGSYLALIAFLLLVPLLVLRILNEEAVLVHELPGYDDYRRKVRWRLIPRIW
jgi:protein-S-isoprenylcysteine O-methyltransferase Ste14